MNTEINCNENYEIKNYLSLNEIFKIIYIFKLHENRYKIVMIGLLPDL